MSEWKRQIGAMTLFVPDLDRAKSFYHEVLGLPVHDVDEDNVMVRFTGMVAFLHRVAIAPEPSADALDQARQGAGQFAIIVDDVDAVSAEVRERGATLLSGPADRPWGMRTITFADPAGHIWEIAQQIPSAGAQ